MQTFVNSALTDRYIQKYYITHPDGSIDFVRPEKLQTISPIKDRQISGIFGWLGDKIADGLGAIGYLFGLTELVPSVNPSAGHHNHYRFVSHPVNSQGTQWGDTGDAAFYFVSAGLPIVDSYLTDLTGTPEWEGSSTYTGYNYHGPNLDPYADPSPNVAGIYVLEYLINPSATLQDYALSYQAIPVMNALKKYLDDNGKTVENREFITWAAEYLMENQNTVSFDDLINSEYDNETPFPTNFELTNYSELSIDDASAKIIMYPQDVQNYPKLTAIVKGLYNKVATTPKIMTALKKYTGLTEIAILNNLKFNSAKSPIIVVRTNEQMKTKNQKTGKITFPYGKTIDNDANMPFLFLNQKYLTLLENSTGANTEALTLLIATTILHEFVHWADNNSALSPSGYKELGEIFEKDAFGGIIEYNIKNGRIYYR